ncbi:tRNA (adenosine(37)-N6)-threonylcarbamoyltransferase complex dimerization subunit type 1 TsaB [Leucobacter rhizosphaerae]|uniref:tRNA (Adenosine(37)-N6)-threonylcarbamoyltransferase complex dimerization subunit type 1 TsaB n=1 Tax=Leucobacter rhizosphaerae TaxID=2932245 RepID=A0ABY4FYH2_9MICO|nr:tRNA (adenosine(37)-N6)-threonylcarbamoyltransferase complex dimerization subunit type 1 TsaB [Leucobacter rhizosphaerae]UOQ61346.1 tRNA (adenosine(37)-N6)-threonylcarbamoyltransferase complex dimerization subunit type 1 TsaB [Leucobacter rhizosphaerae]
MSDAVDRVAFEVIDLQSAASAPDQVLLAIDTALGTSVALGAAGRVVQATSADPLRHAEAIGGMLAGLFEAAGVSPSEVTGVVVGIGPGPFTGLRVGIAAAHAFALGRGVPLLPLQGHEAVALEVLERGASAGVRVIQDAKRRELFVTEYRGLDWAGVPERAVDPHLVPRDRLEPTAADVWPERIPAGRLVELASRRLAAGHGFESDRAVYLRAPDVAQPGAPKRVST